jgi:PAS domain S-box-containing protein
MEHHVTPVYDQENRLIAVEGIGRDVTERRKAAAAVQESELRFRGLFDNANDAILLMEEDKFFECNNKAVEIYGCPKAEIIGKTPWDYSPEMQPDGRTSRDNAKERIEAARKGAPQFFEWVHSRCDGSLFDAEVHLTQLALPEKTLVFAQVRDITNKKKVEEALRQGEEKYRFLTENMADIIWTVDMQMHTTYVSPSVERVLGFTPEERMKLTPEEMLAPDSGK